MSQNEKNAFAIESHSIDYVDPSERNGKVRIYLLYGFVPILHR